MQKRCLKIEISFHFVIRISNTQADAHEILRYAQNDITF